MFNVFLTVLVSGLAIWGYEIVCSVTLPLFSALMLLVNFSVSYDEKHQ